MRIDELIECELHHFILLSQDQTDEVKTIYPLLDPMESKKASIANLQYLMYGRHNRVCSGALEAGYAAFADVLLYLEANLPDNRKQVMTHILDLSRSCGPIYKLGKRYLCLERPERIVLREGPDSPRLVHNETGPAIRFRDGFEVYCLNGIYVSADLVVTPADELDPRLVLSTPYAEVRREIVRKIGVERVLTELGAQTLDSREGYELLSLDLGDGRRRPYLKMRNPSTGTWHIEGVHPDCETVQAALAWRNQTEDPPEVLK